MQITEYDQRYNDNTSVEDDDDEIYTQANCKTKTSSHMDFTNQNKVSQNSTEAADMIW